MKTIGLDFGNYNVYMSCIQDMDPETRHGGVPMDLQDVMGSEGVPSTYVLKKDGTPKIGDPDPGARFSRRGVSLLKRKMGQQVRVRLAKVGEVVVDVDRAITEVATYCIRMANRVLEQETDTGETSSHVALAHPARFNPRQVERLVELVEAATLEDGTPVEVVGTIAEPAAAALDYLSSDAVLGARKEVTALTMDLGAGTFDVSLLTAYPDGKRDAAGNVRYYDCIDTDGIEDLGGNEFTTALYRLFLEKAQIEVPDGYEGEYLGKVEGAKIALTDAEEYEISFYDILTGDDVEVTLTRAEFERVTRGLVDRIVECTNALVARSSSVKVDVIVVTGGGGNMPMIKGAAERRVLPGVPARCYRPSKAISYGASRYFVESHGEAVIKHTSFDLGVRFYKSGESGRYVHVCIPAGSELPYSQAGSVPSRTRREGQIESVFPVMRARVEHPNPHREEDWEKIGSLVFKHAESVPKGTDLCSRFSIDELGMLHVRCWAPQRPQDGMQERPFRWQD